MRTDSHVLVQQFDANQTPVKSAKVVKLMVSPLTNLLSPSIKMLSNGDGLSSALRVPTKIQLTKTSLMAAAHQLKTSSSPVQIPARETSEQQSIEPVVDYHPSTAALPPTPPPPVIDHTNAKGHHVSCLTASVPDRQRIQRSDISDNHPAGKGRRGCV